ncbi:MAG TPA: hypothetical protein VLX11_03665 [Candidatus Acidoferrales bacterium]|nr:hypothetical protein [Candidatus Acidoferrales bacterium]
MILSGAYMKRATTGLITAILVGVVWAEGFAQTTEVTTGVGLQSIIAEVARVVPKASSLKFEDVADSSIIEKLDKSGFIDSLYK